MTAKSEEAWLFVVEWFDPLPQLTKQYLLKYYPSQNQAEMVDVKHRKLFLKKSPCPPGVKADDFYIGAQLVFFSRDLKVVDYGDAATRQKLFRSVEDSILILSSSFSSSNSWGEVIDILLNKLNYSLVKMKSLVMNETIINTIQNIETLQSLSQDNSENIFTEPYLIIQLQKENCLSDLYADLFLLSDTIAPKQCLLYTINNKTDYNSLQTLFFDPKLSPMASATFDNCTCCIIKPHITKAKLTGKVLHDIISEGYEISAVQSVYFTKTQAEEFLEVYKGVVPEYNDHILQLTSGISIALELRAQNAVSTFRQSAGPWDIEMAKALRPKSLRAKYGHDTVRNAVHCTDLENDGIIECEYLFKIMSC